MNNAQTAVGHNSNLDALFFCFFSAYVSMCTCLPVGMYVCLPVCYLYLYLYVYLPGEAKADSRVVESTCVHTGTGSASEAYAALSTHTQKRYTFPRRPNGKKGPPQLFLPCYKAPIPLSGAVLFPVRISVLVFANEASVSGFCLG